ncbi:hypothetical protein GCM10022402_43290 [Salinactinospora qingdaonensis]|uniref:Uncharacterized protein n=1 Tax=Salinactinospora qingdaonensis TaxID=702744 RepID=A0ABP7GB92_9ACTN
MSLVCANPVVMGTMRTTAALCLRPLRALTAPEREDVIEEPWPCAAAPRPPPPTMSSSRSRGRAEPAFRRTAAGDWFAPLTAVP